MASAFVGLNVGGKIYKTTRGTLVSRDTDSFFALLLSDRIPSGRDAEGNYLIDRDGETFREVLWFLRDGEVATTDWKDLSILAKEADFFQLKSLQDKVAERLKNPDSIALNVGGVLYRTSKETLMSHPDSLLSDLCQESGNGVPRDEHGNMVIDRDGHLFRHVLNFLRNGRLFLPDGFDELSMLACEANFYRLPILQEHVNSLISILNYDKQNVLVLDLFQPDSEDICAVYTNAEDVSSLLAFVQDPTIDLDCGDEAKHADIKVDTLLSVVKTGTLSLNPGQLSGCPQRSMDDRRWHLLNEGNFESRKSRRRKGRNPITLSDISNLISEYIPFSFSSDAKWRHLKETRDGSKCARGKLPPKSELEPEKTILADDDNKEEISKTGYCANSEKNNGGHSLENVPLEERSRSWSV